MRKTLAMAIVLVASSCLAATAAPRLSVDLSAYSFPDTVEGMAVMHTFLLTNTGDEELLITEVQVSCGCTTTALASDRLQPGEAVGLTVMVNTEGFRGAISKTIFVASNDPHRQSPNELQLLLTGKVFERQPYQYSVPHLFEMAYVLLDVRDPLAYALGHLAGAMNVPADEVTARAASLPSGVLTIFYDQDGNMGLLEAITQALHEGGVAAAYALRGGLDSWHGNYGSARVVAGADTTRSFLEGAGARNSSSSRTVRDYDVGRLFTDYVVIDIRTEADYAASHLVGAINLSEPALADFLATLPRETPVIIASEDGMDSDRAAESLLAQGFYPKSLLGGLAEWRKQHGNFLLVASGE